MESEVEVQDQGGGGQPPSYANRVKSNTSYKRIERNVILARVQKSDESRDRYFDSELCGQLCVHLGVTPQTDTLGFQTRMDRGEVIVEICLKSHILAKRFSSEMVREMCPGFTNGGTSCHQ